MPQDSLSPATLTAVRDTAASLFWSRYRDDAAPAPQVWNEVIATLLDHRSIRSFLPTPLPAGTLDLLVAAAQSAASSSNLQVWSVVAVEDKARRTRLSKLAGSQKHIVDAPLFLVWLADLARLADIATAEGAEIEGIHYLELLLVGIVDAALAAQNAVVALESLGLGSVYIGAIRNNLEAVAGELALPPLVMPVFGLCIGHPDPAVATGIKPRLPQEVVLHHETYAPGRKLDALARYNAALSSFQREHNLAVEEWTSKVTERVRTPESLAGRHRLGQALRNLGFQLR
jgi:nitroreductase